MESLLNEEKNKREHKALGQMKRTQYGKGRDKKSSGKAGEIDRREEETHVLFISRVNIIQGRHNQQETPDCKQAALIA